MSEASESVLAALLDRGEPARALNRAERCVRRPPAEARTEHAGGVEAVIRFTPGCST